LVLAFLTVSEFPYCTQFGPSQDWSGTSSDCSSWSFQRQHYART
jgi:hypothetical protein